MYCRNCGEVVSDEWVYCSWCGFDKNIGKNYCSSCGKLIEFEDVDKCPMCGYILNVVEKKEIKVDHKPKSLLVAGLLQSLCPFLALGNFYLGYNKLALIQVLVTIFTFGLGFIWPFVNGLMILSGKVKKDAYGVELVD